MFGWLFGKPKFSYASCNHELVDVANLYADQRTIYQNGVDTVKAYVVQKCVLCEKSFNKTIIEKDFPVYMSGESTRRDALIQKLRVNGYKNEEDYLLFSQSKKGAIL